jgi:hypothetical protein
MHATELRCKEITGTQFAFISGVTLQLLGTPAMDLDRFRDKLPESIIDWYVKENLQAKIKHVGNRQEGLILIVRLDKAIHTWRYDESDPVADGRTKPLADWELEVFTKKTTSAQRTAFPCLATEFERRQNARIDCELDANTHSADLPDSIGWGAKVRNISRTGVGLNLCFSFRAGTKLAIKIHCPEREKHAIVLSKVVHIRDQLDGSWHVGCQFFEPISERDLELLLGSQKKTTAN